MSANASAGSRWSTARSATAAGASRAVLAWQSQPASTRRVLKLALAVLAAAVLILGVWRPAHYLWVQAPEQQARQAADLSRMQALAREARELRAMPMAPTATVPVTAVLQRLAPGATWDMRGKILLVTLAPLNGRQLLNLLDALGAEAGARVVESQVQRDAEGRWSGGLALAVSDTPP